MADKKILLVGVGVLIILFAVGSYYLLKDSKLMMDGGGAFYFVFLATNISAMAGMIMVAVGAYMFWSDKKQKHGAKKDDAPIVTGDVTKQTPEEIAASTDITQQPTPDTAARRVLTPKMKRTPHKKKPE